MMKRIVMAAAGMVAGASLALAEPSETSTLIQGATVLLGNGERIDDGDVLIVQGRIEAVGAHLTAPTGARIVDARGRWVTPGLIDVHSHLGVYASPVVGAHSDGNELSGPVTAQVWAEHSVWPQDPGFETALQGGVTTMQILPGSGNLIGGRSVVIKNVPAVTVQDMKFPGAPYGMKMACGENPKRVYGGRNQAPSTRMGNIAGDRQAFIEAREYLREQEKYERELADYDARRGSTLRKNADLKPPTAPKRDLNLETLVGVLKGEVLTHVHCYRADDMVNMLDLAHEFGFRIVAFHHAVEAYKIADRLAGEGVCAAMWADMWGFKMEAFDGIQENLAMVDHPSRGCAIIHSDSQESIQRLNQEAAKGAARGRRMGMDIPPERIIRWITSNPARALGVSDRVGTLERGKMADVVIWSRNPFSVYALADQVFIDGMLRFDRQHPDAKPSSDFLLGQGIDEVAP